MNRGKKVKPFAYSAVFILILIYVCSCASRSATAADKRLYAYLSNSAKYVLLPPQAIEKPIDMAQHISASFGGQDYFFNAWVRADETGMEITLFNELGAAMGELSYRDGYVHFSSPVFPTTLKPEYIVADFQLCFYDPLLIQQALKNCGLVFEADEKVRRILERKNVIINIEKDQKIVQIKNNLRGYNYTLEGDFE